MALSRAKARAKAAREIKMAKQGKSWILKRWDPELRMFLNSHPMPYHAARMYRTAARAHKILELMGYDSESAGDAVEAVFPRSGAGGRDQREIVTRALEWLRGRETAGNPWVSELDTPTHRLRGMGRTRKKSMRALEAAWRSRPGGDSARSFLPVQKDVDTYFAKPGWGMMDGEKVHPAGKASRVYHFFPVSPRSKKYAFFDPTGRIKGDPRTMTRKGAKRFAALMKSSARFHRSWAAARDASEAVRKRWTANPGDPVALRAYMDEDRPPGEGPLNLDGTDDPEDLLAIARALGTGIRPVAEARVLFPGRPEGYVQAAIGLRNYAVNRAVAIQCRRRGDIQGAQMYERIAEKIYRDLPAYAKW